MQCSTAICEIKKKRQHKIMNEYIKLYGRQEIPRVDRMNGAIFVTADGKLSAQRSLFDFLLLCILNMPFLLLFKHHGCAGRVGILCTHDLCVWSAFISDCSANFASSFCCLFAPFPFILFIC